MNYKEQELFKFCPFDGYKFTDGEDLCYICKTPRGDKSYIY